MVQEYTVNVDAHGNATSDFDRVAFAVTVNVHKQKLADVKSELLKHNIAFSDVLKELKNTPNVKIDEATLSSSSTMNKSQRFDKKKGLYVEDGYNGCFQALFESQTPEEASLIYDRLTNLEGFNVSAPEFKLRSQEKLKREALVDAYKRLSERFETECIVLGKDPSHYEIASWKVNYGHNNMAQYANSRLVAAAMRSAASVDLDEIEIQSSKAIVTVYLSVTYVKKSSTQ